MKVLGNLTKRKVSKFLPQNDPYIEFRLYIPFLKMARDMCYMDYDYIHIDAQKKPNSERTLTVATE